MAHNFAELEAEMPAEAIARFVPVHHRYTEKSLVRQDIEGT